MTRDYSKNHRHDDPVVDPVAADPLAPAAPAREKRAYELRDEELVKVRDEISALFEKARAVQYARSDPAAAKSDGELVAELQDIGKQIHALNAKWLAGPGYEYVPPPYVPNVQGEPGAPWAPAAAAPLAPEPAPADAPI